MAKWCIHPNPRAAENGGIECPDCGTSTGPINPYTLDPFEHARGRVSSPKSRPDLIPASSLLEIGHVLAWGKEQPGDPERWRAQGVRGNLAAAMRHTLEHLRGVTTDAESKRPHLAHAGARTLFALALHMEQGK